MTRWHNKLVGAGGTAFDIVSATGQLQVGAVLDHETDGSYTVTVQASDGKNVAFKDVTVTVTGVDELPTLSGDAAPAVADSGAGFVSTYTVADPEGDAIGAITWALAGTDSSYFTIEDGRLSFRAAPDYEGPEPRRRLRCDRPGRRRRPAGRPPHAGRDRHRREHR